MTVQDKDAINTIRDTATGAVICPYGLATNRHVLRRSRMFVVPHDDVAVRLDAIDGYGACFYTLEEEVHVEMNPATSLALQYVGFGTASGAPRGKSNELRTLNELKTSRISRNLPSKTQVGLSSDDGKGFSTLGPDPQSNGCVATAKSMSLNRMRVVPFNAKVSDGTAEVDKAENMEKVA